MYYLYGRTLVFCLFLLTSTLNQKLPVRITFFRLLSTHQYQTWRPYVLHLSADFANVFCISIYGGSGSVPHFRAHISGPEARMKNYRTVSGRYESRDSCDMRLVVSYLSAFLPICPEFVALKTIIHNTMLWREPRAEVWMTLSHAYSHYIYRVSTLK